jgi:hypothetical protein
MRKSLAYVSLVVMSAIAALSPAHSDGRFWLVGEPTKGESTCEEFFDKWDVPGAPAGMLAMAGVGREVAAAQDCVKQNKIDLACKHWRAIVVNLDKVGPPLNESRGDVVTLMQQNKCESISEPDQGSQSPSGASPKDDGEEGATPHE